MVTSQEEVLMKTLMNFFKKKDYLKQMVEIKNGDSKISLRILDWFATRYSNTFKIKYPKSTKNRKIFIYFDYKDQVKAYKKKNFDPFCRGEKIILKEKKLGDITTTVGQLNFFRWVFTNKLLKIIDDYLDEIKDDMVLSGNKKNKKGGTKTNMWKIHLKNAYPVISQKYPELKFPQIVKKISELYQKGEIYKKPVTIKKKKKQTMKVSAKQSISKHNVKIIVKFE